MKTRLASFILGLSMLFALGLMATPADAQVVVKIGPQKMALRRGPFFTPAHCLRCGLRASDQ
jgi:hypothetical protein